MRRAAPSGRLARRARRPCRLAACRAQCQRRARGRPPTMDRSAPSQHPRAHPPSNPVRGHAPRR
eukprot:scaffold88044_cov75-Phaeocystis_antarctica.AAC.5